MYTSWLISVHWYGFNQFSSCCGVWFSFGNIAQSLMSDDILDMALRSDKETCFHIKKPYLV